MTQSSFSPGTSTRQDQSLRDQAQYWVTRLAAGDIKATELDELEAWLAADQRHAHAFSRERTLWQDLHAVADKIMEADSNIVPLRPLVSGRRPVVREILIAVAASLAVLIMAPSLMLHLRADHRTDAGEVRTLYLPDGTTAVLDSASAISVDFDKGERVVRLLAGRVWFDVRHEQRPFMVEAWGGVTRDIGTGFEVARGGGGVGVAVTEGSVEVLAPDGRQRRFMRVGERIHYSASGLGPLTRLPVSQLAAWRNGEILLENKPVDAAIAEIARYRRATIWTIGDFSTVQPVSGLFLTGRPDEALETLIRMRQLRVTRLPGGYLIVRPGTTT